jgi:hypothetical protein
MLVKKSTVHEGGIRVRRRLKGGGYEETEEWQDK